MTAFYETTSGKYLGNTGDLPGWCSWNTTTFDPDGRLFTPATAVVVLPGHWRFTGSQLPGLSKTAAMRSWPSARTVNLRQRRDQHFAVDGGG